MTAPARYRKKPVEVDAAGPIDSFNAEAIAHWCGGRVISDGPGLAISTLEGEMRADPGDYVIRGVAGEFYPCKPDIFAATYEPATVNSAPPPIDVSGDGFHIESSGGIS